VIRMEADLQERIRKEAKEIREGDAIWSKVLHKTIVKKLEMHRPEVVEAGMVEDLALWLQMKMWAAEKQNLAAGMYVTDAREQAERDWLDLDPPEEEEPEPDWLGDDQTIR
jgi:adenosyl cobinamide kinase/adenosyl cobinamide phosphate guanylyltransferase